MDRKYRREGEKAIAWTVGLGVPTCVVSCAPPSACSSGIWQGSSSKTRWGNPNSLDVRSPGQRPASLKAFVDGVIPGELAVILITLTYLAGGIQDVTHDLPHQGKGTLRFEPCEKPLELHFPRLYVLTPNALKNV